MRDNPSDNNFFPKGSAMNTIEKILSRLLDMFRRKRTMTIPVVSSAYMNSLYGTVVSTKPAPYFFLICHRPGEGKSAYIRCL